MKSNTFATIAWLRYLQKSGTRHSVHSPFVYALVDNVIRNRNEHPALIEISKLRHKLSRKTQLIEITDFGAGSGKRNYEHRFESVGSITRKSAVTEKYGRLLFRLVEHFKPLTIIELGTSLGISTLYIAKAYPSARVYTIEGCATRSEQASNSFNALNAPNIELNIGRFDLVLPDVIKQVEKLDFVFIDGHHTCNATLNNFEQLLKIAHNDTVFVIDDIHWSAGMEAAWGKIADHERVTATIDLFRMGIVFLKNELSKQKFVIRF
jgi:predicted O-methyltransferase YrrM